MVRIKAVETIHDSRITITSNGQQGTLHRGDTGETSADAAKDLQDLGFVKIIGGDSDKKDTAPEKKHIENAPENKMRKINKSTKSKKE